MPSTLYARRWQALIVLAFSLLVVTVGNTILNVGLPTIQEELDASASELQWIVDGYLLLFAGLLLAAGSLGDRFGRRRALLAGLAVFGAGSLWASFAGSPTELIAARALMGVGAAGIMPTTLSVITNIFPEDERPKAIAAWAAVAGMGIAIGPIVGGWMIEHFDWNAMFLFNLPAVVVLIGAALVLVPESRDPEAPRLDWRGCLLSFTGLSGVVWALIEAPDRGWTDATIVGAGAGGLAVLGAFIWWERRCAQPMLDVSVFRNLRFSAASLSVTFVYFALMGVMYFLTSYLQSVLGHDALGAGVRMLPIAAGMMLTAKTSVRLTQKIGTKVPVASGLAAVAGALVLVTGFSVETGDTELSLVLALMGAGIGMAMAPATEAIMGSLPKAKAGVGSAMNDVVREVAGTLGIAVLGSVLASAYAGGMDGASELASDSIGGAHAVAAELGGHQGAELLATANTAFVDAMATTASIAAAVAIVGALIAAAFLPARGREEAEPAGVLSAPAAA